MSGRSGVFGFALFKTIQEAATAVLLFNETAHFGRIIRVAFAQPTRWNHTIPPRNTQECVCSCHRNAVEGKIGQTNNGWGEPSRNQSIEPSKTENRCLSIRSSFALGLVGEEKNESNTTSRKRRVQSNIKLLLKQKNECKREKLENSWKKTGDKKLPDGLKENVKQRANGKDDGLALLAI